jgi:SAM-dependent methyltransferase
MRDAPALPSDWLVDPVTKNPPSFAGDVAHCDSGDYRHYAAEGYWDFLPADLVGLFGEKARIWETLQRNGEASYLNDPERNLGVGPRADFLAFAEFSRFRGNVLDVGCGPQKLPTHMAASSGPDVFFCGIDPLVGDQPRGFAFVRGLGEYLPFRAALFDQVLFVTSLDHFLDPTPPLIEARRVLSPGGEVCVWIGEKDKNAPRPAASPDWYRRLEVPGDAQDAFHYRRFGIEDFERFVAGAGLAIADRRVTEVDQWRRNVFFRLRAVSAS